MLEIRFAYLPNNSYNEGASTVGTLLLFALLFVSSLRLRVHPYSIDLKFYSTFATLPVDCKQFR
jgi:hypothetical protein